MSTDIRIVMMKEFLRVTPKGELDFKASRQIFQDVVFGEDAPERILVDLRDANWQGMNDAELLGLLDVCWSHPRSMTKKVVFLGVKGPHNPRGELFNVLARSRGLRMSRYFSFEEAINVLQVI